MPAPAQAHGMIDRPGEILEMTHHGIIDPQGQMPEAAMGELLDEALKRFADKPDAVRALGVYVSPEDTVGIKINALASPGHATHPALVRRLVEHLRALGIPPDHIVVFDQYGRRMRRGGYRLAQRRGEIRVVSHKMTGYGRRAVRFDGKRSFRWAQTMHDVTAIVNMPVPKDHDLCGVTGALKNLAFGSIDRVSHLHAVLHEAIPWIYGQPEIADKTRLCICDATRVLYNGGPQDKPRYRVAHNSLLVSEDPVAIDWAILELVNVERLRVGMGLIDPDPSRQGPNARRSPRYLHRAVAHGLGSGPTALRWARAVGGALPKRYVPQHIGS